MSRHSRQTGARHDRTNLYSEITDKVITELEVGRVPWVQPWGTAAANSECQAGALPGVADWSSGWRRSTIQVQPLRDGPDGRRQRTGAPVVKRAACCSASSPTLSEWKQIERLARRSPTKLRADQQ